MNRRNKQRLLNLLQDIASILCAPFYGSWLLWGKFKYSDSINRYTVLFFKVLILVFILFPAFLVGMLLITVSYLTRSLGLFLILNPNEALFELKEFGFRSGIRLQ